LEGKIKFKKKKSPSKGTRTLKESTRLEKIGGVSKGRALTGQTGPALLRRQKRKQGLSKKTRKS